MTLACTYWPGAFALSHLWLCEAMGCSPLGSSVHGIFPAKILEPVAISSSGESSQPRDWIWVSGSLELNSLLLSHQGSPYADLVDAFFFFFSIPIRRNFKLCLLCMRNNTHSLLTSELCSPSLRKFDVHLTFCHDMGRVTVCLANENFIEE